ncbi:hypothetical protein ACFFX0_03150 [Citricoccus parietis]|uniref:Uncharacterized protein n=1 Tax=Citricoccus parietis TaxID=592307 RepID=A0ABV5FU95_9MICC
MRWSSRRLDTRPHRSCCSGPGRGHRWARQRTSTTGSPCSVPPRAG